MSYRKRYLGPSDLAVSPVGLGCWPIAGVSTLDVNEQDSLATIHAALDAGINFIDTAYSYGYAGEADQLLAQVLKERRSEVVLASKVGSHYTPDKQRMVDGRPETLIEHTQQARQRLGVEQIDIMYLHQPDPHVPLAESATALREVIDRGWVRYAGVSNVNSQQLAEFHAVCPVIVVQPPFNMLQREAVDDILPFCQAHSIGIACYWALMKGLLAGKMARDHQFDSRDRRLTYEVYQGAAWQRAQDLLDQLRAMASELDCTVAQLVVAWTVAQPGITSALCGAKRPEQIQETAAAMRLHMDAELLAQINGLLR
jgi:aryl-alcohol dehydrogenase-like predicted oxidoreductase